MERLVRPARTTCLARSAISSSGSERTGLRQRRCSRRRTSRRACLTKCVLLGEMQERGDPIQIKFIFIDFHLHPSPVIDFHPSPIPANFTPSSYFYLLFSLFFFVSILALPNPPKKTFLSLQRHDSQERMEAGSPRAASSHASLDSSPSGCSFRLLIVIVSCIEDPKETFSQGRIG
jgi:hypothetical protein